MLRDAVPCGCARLDAVPGRPQDPQQRLGGWGVERRRPVGLVADHQVERVVLRGEPGQRRRQLDGPVAGGNEDVDLGTHRGPLGGRRGADAGDDRGGRVVGQVVQHPHLPAEPLDDRGLGQHLRGVVAALGVHLRPDQLDQLGRGVLAEGRDEVDALDGADDPGPVGERVHRTFGALEPGDAVVAVQRHDQQVAQPAGLAQVGDVPAVQHVEAAVGEHHPVPAQPVLLDDGEQVAVAEQPAPVRGGELRGERPGRADRRLLLRDDDVRRGLRHRERLDRGELGAQRGRVGGGEGVARAARPGVGGRVRGGSQHRLVRRGGQPDDPVDVEGEQHVRSSAGRDERVPLRGGPGRAVVQRLLDAQQLRRLRGVRGDDVGPDVAPAQRVAPSTTSSGTSSRSATSRSRTSAVSTPSP